MTSQLDLLQAFNGDYKILKIVGIWNYEKEILYKIYKFIIFVYSWMFITTSILFLIKSDEDQPEVIESIYLTIGAVEAALKTLMFRLRFEEIAESWKQIKVKEFQPRNEIQKKILQNYINISNIIFKVYASSFVVACTALLSFPALSQKKNLPSHHWVPFEYHQPFMYNVMYVYSSLGLVYLGFSNCGMDLCFYISMIQIGGQCEILADTLKNIHILAESYKSELQTKSLDFAMNTILVESVRHYELILQYSNQLASSFKEIITFQFVPSMGMVCMVLYKLSVMKTVNGDTATLILFGYTATSELFFYCLFGDFATEKSAKIFYAAFESIWYEAIPSFKDNLIIFMQRVQQPIVFYSWNIFPVNYETFKGIMQKCWSLFLALKNLNDV